MTISEFGAACTEHCMPLLAFHWKEVAMNDFLYEKKEVKPSQIQLYLEIDEYYTEMTETPEEETVIILQIT